MLIDDLSKQDIRGCFNFLENYISKKDVKWVKYLDLGCKVIKLVSYTNELLHQVEKQLTYILKDSADKFDATLIVWQEDDVLENIAKNISPKLDIKKNLAFRIKTLAMKAQPYEYSIFDKDFSAMRPIINIESQRGFVMANDYENNVYYYGINNLDPEEFIKEGHIFVQYINQILKTDNTNIAHGAVIGLNGDGILICARGQRGKSTLSVLSMMEGFEYVSDDYLTLAKIDNQLYSYPIYSIITLSPKMYNELYDRLDGSRFISNNARKDKYVFNIANFHNRFKTKYPIKFCLFPEIVTDKDPSIFPCEKGRAIAQLIQSTLAQTQDVCDKKTVRKMINMIKDYDFYKFNLCHDIKRNTEFLRDFMNNLEKRERKTFVEDKIALDITFDIANVLNLENGTIYTMNRFATNVFENLKNGAELNSIIEELNKLPNKELVNDLKYFIQALKLTEILDYKEVLNKKANINFEFAKDEDYKLSFVEFDEKGPFELILKLKENKND